MKDLPAREALILEAAAKIGATAEPTRPEWIGAVLNAEVLRSSSRGAPLQRDASDLPSVVGAIRLDGTPVLIGELPTVATAAAVEEALRRYRNQATIARSWLGPAGPNLQIFLYGPIGALRDRNWRQLAAAIEADDRVCRKLVWLFNEEPDNDAAVQFLERTFVARPWAEESVMAELDRLEAPLPPGWAEAVDDLNLESEPLVRVLVRLEGDDE